MKKNSNTKKSVDTAMQQKAENNITIFNCSIILYALVLIVVQSMANSSATALSAATIRRVLMYSGIVVAMVIAAYSAYKSNKSLFKYAFMGLFVSISTASILYASPWGLRATVIGLVAAFIFTCVYAALTDKKLYYTSKKVRKYFKTAIAVVYGVLLLVVIINFTTNTIKANNYQPPQYFNQLTEDATVNTEVIVEPAN